jgi:hypothetical protein
MISIGEYFLGATGSDFGESELAARSYFQMRAFWNQKPKGKFLAMA